MQVYKLFLRLLYRHKAVMLMYTGIFCAIFILTFSQAKRNDDEGYANQSCSFAAFDYDDSTVSRGLVEYLRKENKLVSIAGDDNDTVQDELFNRNIDCALIIPEGFEEKVMEGNADGLIELKGIPGTVAISMFGGRLNGYMRILNSYIDGGCSEEEAVKLADQTSDIKPQVSLLSEKSGSQHSSMYYFFLYNVYIFITMAIIVVGTILSRLNAGGIKSRINCSAYRFSSYNREILFGVATTGLLICGVFLVIAALFFRGQLFTLRGGLFVLHMLSIMVVALGLAFFVAQLAKSDSSLTMIANIVGLGVAFLCGVFVPMEYMSKGVVRFAHILPGYWYVVGCGKIDTAVASDSLVPLAVCFGMELLFAALFAAAGVVVSRAKYNKIK